MAKAGKKFSTDQILLRDAMELLVGRLGSPAPAKETLKRIPWRCRPVADPERGVAVADPDSLRSNPAEIDFEESKARALTGYSSSGEPIYGPWHYAVTVDRLDVLALLLEPSGHKGAGDVAAREGYQDVRITRALDRLENAGLKLTDYTDAELRPLVLKQIQRDEPKQTGIRLPSPQTLNRVIRRRRAK